MKENEMGQPTLVTPDPDAPPVYEPPEGHYVPVLGRDVPDGWEGRYINGSGGFDWSTKSCRSTGRDALFEVRRVPAPEPATEWVPWWEAVAKGRKVKHDTGYIVTQWVHASGGKFWLEGANLDPRVMVRDDGMVEVLAEGER